MSQPTDQWLVSLYSVILFDMLISEEQIHADVTVVTRMFCVTEIRRQIYWFCCDEIFNETFRTSNIDIINGCRSNFSFMLPSEIIEIRKAKFEGKFNICNSLRYYFGL